MLIIFLYNNKVNEKVQYFFSFFEEKVIGQSIFYH